MAVAVVAVSCGWVAAMDSVVDFMWASKRSGPHTITQ